MFEKEEDIDSDPDSPRKPEGRIQLKVKNGYRGEWKKRNMEGDIEEFRFFDIRALSLDMRDYEGIKILWIMILKNLV